MRIVLVRHGRIGWDFRTPVRGRAFGDWRRGEDEAALDSTYPPPAALTELIRGATCVFTSPLRRSQASAALLAPGVATLADADFREAELPCGFRSGVRLPPPLWGLAARSAWCCGWSGGVESFAAARQRAAKAAALLRARAVRDGLAVLVGHGFMNILIAQHLRAAGWRGPRLPSQRHWGFGVYSR